MGPKLWNKKKMEVEHRLGIDLHGGRTFNKFGGGKCLCSNRVFCFITVREGELFLKMRHNDNK